MKSLLVLVALLGGAMSSFAQGSLTPPGAPGQTMKTLAQIEPRTVIPGGTASYTITVPGSYVLGGNITVAIGSGIAITVNHVTLDLNGFTISSTHPTGYGAGVSIGNTGLPLSNVRVTNGHIVGGSTYDTSTRTFTPGGFNHGVFLNTIYGVNIQVDHIIVTGIVSQGIGLSAEDSVANCNVITCGGVGIIAGIVSDCTSRNCVDDAIIAKSATNCRGVSVGLVTGAYGINSSVVTGSTGVADAGAGILGETIHNSKGTSVTGDGISGGMVLGCHGTSGSGFGIAGKVVSYSYGSSTSGAAIYASQSAIGCAVGTGAVSVGTALGKQLNTP